MEPLRPAVVLSGRFQPFHAGHHAAFRALQARFGAENVWIASSDRPSSTPGRPSPLRFEEKRAIICGLFEVPSERVVLVRSPYAPAEVLSGLDPARTAYVAALGARDEGRLRSRYWAPLPEDPGTPLEPYPTRGYFLVLPPQEGDLSASAVRAALGSPDRSLEEKERAFRELYPRYDEALFRLLVERLGATG